MGGPDRGPGVTSKTRTATTSSQGRYRVKTSPAGWYQVKAAVDLGGPCKIRVGAKKPVKVGSGKVKQVNLKLPDLVELRYRPVAADGYSRALPSEVCWRKQTFDGKAWVRAYVPARSSHVDITWHDVIMDHRFIEQDGRSFFVDPGRPVTRHSLPKATDGVIDLGYLWEPGTAGTATVAAKFRLEGRSSTRVALERQDSAADLWRIVTTVSDEDELTFPEVPVGRFKLVVDGQSTRYTVDVPEGGAVDLGTVDLRLTSQVRVRTSVDSKLRGEDWAVDLTAKHHFDFPGDGEYTATPRTVAKVSVRPSMKDTKVSTVRVR